MKHLSAIGIPIICIGSLIKSMPNAQAAAPLSEFAIGPYIGTQGIGVSLSTPVLSKYLNLTVGYSRFSLNYRSAYQGQKYRVDLRFGGAPIYLSLYPLGPHFHLDAGIFINQNRVGTSAFPAPGGIYFYHNHRYYEKNLGPVHGTTHFDAIASYVGVGWGNPFFGTKWTLMFNGGVILEGGDHARLSAKNEDEVSGARNSIDIHQATFSHGVGILDAFPMINVALDYRF